MFVAQGICIELGFCSCRAIRLIPEDCLNHGISTKLLVKLVAYCISRKDTSGRTRKRFVGTCRDSAAPFACYLVDITVEGGSAEVTEAVNTIVSTCAIPSDKYPDGHKPSQA